MSSYEIGQEIQYRSDWEFVDWVRGRIHSAVIGYGRNPVLWYYRIIPQNVRGVSIREVTVDGAHVAIAPPTEIRPVSPLVLLAECAGEVADFEMEA
jgi:hypothetical protein